MYSEAVTQKEMDLPNYAIGGGLQVACPLPMPKRCDEIARGAEWTGRP
jgi:hypothetical protein